MTKLLSLILSIFTILTFSISTINTNADARKPMWGCATEATTGDFNCPNNAHLIIGPWMLMEYDDDAHTKFLRSFDEDQNKDKIPYINYYTIADTAKNTFNISDCNEGAANLCNGEATTFLKNNIEAIKNVYRENSQKIRNVRGDQEIYIHVEPDFYQYHTSANDKLTIEEAHRYMNELTDIIKQELPNATLVEDVSPWNQNQTNWSGGFRNFSYGAVTGKYLDGYTGMIDNKYIDYIADEVGKPIIANTAYTVGGAMLGYNQSWEGYQHDVHAVIQSNLENDRYEQFINQQNGDSQPYQQESNENFAPEKQEPVEIQEYEPVEIVVENTPKGDIRLTLDVEDREYTLTHTQVNNFNEEELQTLREFEIMVERMNN